MAPKPRAETWGPEGPRGRVGVGGEGGDMMGRRERVWVGKG